MSYTFNRQYPATRLRRLRYNDNVRSMIREVELHPKHFIAPVFVLEGENPVSYTHLSCRRAI